MIINNENFQAWMERIMDRLDKQDKALEKLGRHRNTLDGELLFDNQDLCQLLHVSKRTLQRYRSTGELTFYRIYQKTYYKESDVHRFIRENFDKKRNSKKPLKTLKGNDNPEDTDNL